MLTPGTFLDAVACGLALFVAIACTAKTSGGCINPAVGFALTVTASIFDIKGDQAASDYGLKNDLWIYISAPLVGSILSFLFYRYVHEKIRDSVPTKVE